MTISIHVPLAGDDFVSSGFLPRYKNFYPRPPCGGRPALRSDGRRQKVFLSTSPLRGTTKLQEYEYYWNKISIHVPLAGDDSLTLVWRSCRIISIHVPLAGDDDWLLRYQDCLRTISIHVPLAGDDVVVPQNVKAAKRISIHVPLAGDDKWPPSSPAELRISIHVPLAGDDCGSSSWTRKRKYFYPRPPCGGRPGQYKNWRKPKEFLSTSPLRGTTRVFGGRGPWGGEFLSTSPLRGTTSSQAGLHGNLEISIHVPLAGDDTSRHYWRRCSRNFYPRPPCGGRPVEAETTITGSLFLSTSPLRGTTAAAVHSGPEMGISIHVPLAGDDLRYIRRKI